MKAAIGCLIGLVFVVSLSAEPLLEGRVRLESGQPVADAQVWLFDLTDLRQGAIARAMTDGTGYFALPLAALTGRALPDRFTLGPNYPNPFNPSTIIPYQLAASSQVRLEVFNLLGQHIATLVDGERPAGFHTATWHATDGAGRAVGAGVYIYRMTVGVERQTGRMVLLDGQAGLAAGGTAFVMPGSAGVGVSNEAEAQVYGLVVSGSGLVPYVDSSFRVESGMAPVELVVSSGQLSAGKATDDDCAFCDLFGTFNDEQEEEEDETEEAEEEEAEETTEEETTEEETTEEETTEEETTEEETTEEETTEEETTEEETTEEEGDLIVYASVGKTILTTGQAFTLRARVQNQGTDEAQELVLSYYRSSNATISTQDALLGTDEVGSLAASSTSRNESISLTAPSTPGTYYYGACVASVSGESNTDNNCSSAVRIMVGEEETDDGRGTGGEDWDLVIQSFEVSDVSLTAGQSFMMETTLYNQGANSVSAFLYYFRSTDATLDATDKWYHIPSNGSWYRSTDATEALIHEDLFAVTGLKSSETQVVSLDWIAPPYAGTYYYQVCAPGPIGNCSTSVRVTVEGSEGGRPDLMVPPPFISQYVRTPNSQFTFEVEIVNIGTGPAAATTARYFRSDDTTFDADDLIIAVRPASFRNIRNNWSSWIGYMWTPIEEGTYYYGVCVDPVPGETNIENNCNAVPMIVEDNRGGSPDLIVIAPSILDHRPTTGEFRLWAVVRNIGAGRSDGTTLRYYRSDDVTIDRTDTQVNTQNVFSLAAEVVFGIQQVREIVTAPTSPGTYYYGACVDPVPGESDMDNNCSEAVPMNVGVPDLAVGLAWVSTSVPLAGESLTLTATVRNQGPDEAAATTLRYYRSDDATIDATDTAVGTDAVSSLTGFDGLVSGPGSRLAASSTSREAISVSVPSSPGTYYYGACIDGIPGEANTDNNCSVGAYVRVLPSGEDPFNIELVFVSDFTDAHKDMMQQAARHLETIITEGLPDVNFSGNPHSRSFGEETIIVNDTVDDLRIFVRAEPFGPGGAWGTGGPSYTRSGDPIGLPALGVVTINSSPRFLTHLQSEPLWQEERWLRDLMIHETLHVLGFFGALWLDRGLLHDQSGDTYFSGELAIEAFNAAGGENYSWNKVPVEVGRWASSCGVPSHWRPAVFQGFAREFGAEIMESGIGRDHALSAITIQSLADLGYVVDVSRADPYRLPASVSTARPPTASAKSVATQDSDLGALGPIYVGDEQGNIIRTLGD